MDRNEKLEKKFNENLEDLLNIEITLEDIALSNGGMQDVLESINKVEYEDRELARTKDILLATQDKIAQAKIAQEYLKTVQDSAEKIKENIRGLVDKLIERKRDISNLTATCQDVKRSYGNILRGLRIIAEVLSNSKLEPDMVQGSLKMIADANKVCMSGCKNMVVTLLTNFGDDISKKFNHIVKIDDEQNQLKRVLKNVFYKARVNVARKAINCFFMERLKINTENPHYKALCTEVLNEIYNFNIPDIDSKDTFQTDIDKARIKWLFLNYIGSINIFKIVYAEAIEIFHNEFQNNRKMFEYLVIWGNQYITKNKLLDQVGDVVFFLSRYVTKEDHDYEPRYAALKEIIRDSGFVKKVLSEKEYLPTPKEIGFIIHDMRTSEEIYKFNQTFIEKIDNENFVKIVIDGISYTKNYEILSQEVLQKLIEKQSQIAIEYLLKAKGRVKIENIDKFNVDNDTRVSVTICLGKDQEKIQFLKEYMKAYKRDFYRVRSMLVYAISRGSKDIANWLIENDVELNIKMEKGQSVLHYAIINKMYNIVGALIDRGVDVNIRDEYGKTALLYAYDLDVPKDISRKLFEKSDITQDLCDNYRLLLSYAIEVGAPERVINTLIESRLDMEKINFKKVIFKSVFLGKVSLKIIKKLVDKGLDIHVVDERTKQTALMQAICSGASEDIVNYFINKEVDVDATDNKGRTALMYALIMKEPIEVIKNLLKKKAAINKFDKDKITPLGYAIKEGYPIEGIEFLVEKGAKLESALSHRSVREIFTQNISALNMLQDYLDKEDRSNSNIIRTHLMHAILYNVPIDVFKELLNKGESIQEKDSEGNTILMYAISQDKLDDRDEIVKELISRDVSLINEQNNDGYTALMTAVRYRHEKVIKMLIDAKADVNKVDKDGRTELLFLSGNVFNRDEEECVKRIIDMLLDAKADMYVEDNRGESLFQKMSRMYWFDDSMFRVFNKLMNRHDPSNKYQKTVLMCAMDAKQDVYKILKLIKQEQKIDKTDIYGRTLLMYAARNGYGSKVMKALVDKGQKISSLDNNGKSLLEYAVDGEAKSIIDSLVKGTKKVNLEKLLIYAAKQGSLNMMKLLVKCGKLDINNKDENGWTILMHFIKEGNYKRGLSWARWFKDNGVNIEEKNNDGQTAVDLAKGKEHSHGIQYLFGKRKREEEVPGEKSSHKKEKYKRIKLELAQKKDILRIIKILGERRGTEKEKIQKSWKVSINFSALTWRIRNLQMQNIIREVVFNTRQLGRVRNLQQIRHPQRINMNDIPRENMERNGREM
ncbi:MAG: ankyrin repeat domain-containing protein [Clostridiales bacterium]|nr:ankyrin repeat domain-containing protein [Clostridiales bacterium]